MGQPIKLVKGTEKMTVYGRAQAAVHIAEGWQAVDEKITVAAPTPAPKPKTTITKPKPAARKPRARKPKAK